MDDLQSCCCRDRMDLTDFGKGCIDHFEGVVESVELCGSTCEVCLEVCLEGLSGCGGCDEE